MKFLKPESSGNDFEYGLQNSELYDGLTLNKYDILKFSEAYSNFANILIDELVLRYSSKVEISKDSLKIVFRRALVPITHFFWNQICRIQHSYLMNKGNLSVEDFLYSIPVINTIEDFEGEIGNEDFQEFSINYLSEIWSLKKTKKLDDSKVIVNKNTIKTSSNQLFSLGKNKDFLNRFINISSKLLERINFLSRYPVLTFANAESALRIRLLYLTTFRHIDNPWKLKFFKKNLGFREEFFCLKGLNCNKWIDYWQETGLTKEQISLSFRLYSKFLTNLFPIQFLEGIVENLIIASNAFRKNDKKILLSSGDGNIYSTFLIAAAKIKKFTIIKAQHGGHYGYYKDNRPALDIELPGADIFLTWGWTKMHEGKQLEHIQCIPMPSPWLSERKKYFKSNKLGSNKEYDVLWMPQMMKRFTGAPQGASSIRRDVLPEFSKAILNLAKALNNYEINTFIKPYNSMSISLMDYTYSSIKSLKYLTISNNFDKGLSLELIKNTKIVLWDQIGTGFLECIVSGIPSIVLWDRLYCEEEEWTREDFNILSKEGMIHNSINSLMAEILVIKKNPKKWLEKPSRLEAIKVFCIKYALTQDKWWKVWKNSLKGLNKDFNYAIH